MTKRFVPTCGSPEHLLNRRAFLGGIGGALAGTIGLDILGNPLLANQMQRQQKRVIMLFLSGGASQFETWDPRPGRPTGVPSRRFKPRFLAIGCAGKPESLAALRRMGGRVRLPGADGRDCIESPRFR